MCDMAELAGTPGLIWLNPVILQMRKLRTRRSQVTCNIASPSTWV